MGHMGHILPTSQWDEYISRCRATYMSYMSYKNYFSCETRMILQIVV